MLTRLHPLIRMAMRRVHLRESWVCERAGLQPGGADTVESLSLQGTYREKIVSLGDAFKNFKSLRSLDLSRNILISLEGIEYLHSLSHLNLYYNDIASLEEIRHLRGLLHLKSLDLRLNPVTRQDADYRLFVIHSLSSLEVLDERPVRESEKKTARYNFQETPDGQSARPTRSRLFGDGGGAKAQLDFNLSNTTDQGKTTNQDLRPGDGDRSSSPSRYQSDERQPFLHPQPDFEDEYRPLPSPTRSSLRSPSSRAKEGHRVTFADSTISEFSSKKDDVAKDLRNIDDHDDIINTRDPIFTYPDKPGSAFSYKNTYLTSTPVRKDAAGSERMRAGTLDGSEKVRAGTLDGRDRRTDALDGSERVRAGTLDGNERVRAGTLDGNERVRAGTLDGNDRMRVGILDGRDRRTDALDGKERMRADTMDDGYKRMDFLAGSERMSVGTLDGNEKIRAGTLDGNEKIRAGTLDGNERMGAGTLYGEQMKTGTLDDRYGIRTGTNDNIEKIRKSTFESGERLRTGNLEDIKHNLYLKEPLKLSPNSGESSTERLLRLSSDLYITTHLAEPPTSSGSLSALRKGFNDISKTYTLPSKPTLTQAYSNMATAKPANCRDYNRGWSPERTSTVHLSQNGMKRSSSLNSLLSPKPSDGYSERPRENLYGVNEIKKRELSPSRRNEALSISEVLQQLMDLVDRYWNGSGSLLHSQKFLVPARELLTRLLSSHHTPEMSPGYSALLPDSRSSHRQLEDGDSIESVKLKLIKVMEENHFLRSKIHKLENQATRKEGAGNLPPAQEDLHQKYEQLSLQVESLQQQLQKTHKLQETVSQLHNGQRSLQSTNEYLLQQLNKISPSAKPKSSLPASPPRISTEKYHLPEPTDLSSLTSAYGYSQYRNPERLSACPL